MGKFRRLRVILGLDKEDIPGLIVGVTRIHDMMSENSTIFTTPNPSMSVLMTQITGLGSAQQTVKNTRATGATEARDVARDVLWTGAGSECSYVQVLCDQSPGNAANYAAAAGMRIAGVPVHPKPILQALLTSTQGNVAVEANAKLLVPPANKKSTRRTYLWRASVDGGKTFVTGDPTPVAHTLFQGLPLNTLVGFQVAVKDSTGTSEWSQTVVVFVH
jgi:hypothetical protein